MKSTLLILSLIFVLFISCFNQANSINTILDIDIYDPKYNSLNYSIKDFEKIGFKISKKYDVSELPGATSAFYGFWGLKQYERREYEIRIYPSNENARLEGISFAEEASGQDAIIKKSDATWKEGVKDRRFVGPFGSSKNYPKYLDYLIWGNLIILCPSEKSEGVIGASDPIENCKKLIKSLDY